LLDDFNLSFDNLCALLYNNVGRSIDKSKVREILEQISQTEGLTLQEIDGKYQFMTNAILGIREERNKIIPRDSEKADVLQKQLQDILTPAPSVNVFSSKTITAGVELTERNRSYLIYPTSSLKINIRFVNGPSFEETHQNLLIESTRQENNKTMYWLCTLGKDKESILQEIVRSQSIKNRHQNETNKEIQAYLRAQSDTAEEEQQQLSKILKEAQANSEIIFRGTPQQVDGETYKTVALKSIAEKVFEKYPLASTNMKSDCVNKVASYNDVTTIPSSLNPFGIIKISDGTIDISNQAIVEVKDFIAYRNEATGQEILSHFERDPYGWSKDTVRYIVALMLKASIIQIRVAGKNITVFGDSAVEAMSTNNSFNKISVSLNTEGALTVQELLKAAQNLMSMFNSPRTAPVKDQIAKEAYKKVKYYQPRFNKLLPDFENLHLAGLQKLQQALNYAQRIIDSEGGEAAYLLGKDADCYNSFKYAMDILKCNDQASLLDQLKHINHIADESDTISELQQLADYRKQVKDVRQLYNEYISNPDLHLIVSDITDLKNQFDSYLNQACIEFQTQSNEQLNNSRECIKAMPEYAQLDSAHQEQIDTELDELNIEFSSPSVEILRQMANKYVTYYLPTGRVNAIQGEVKDNAKLTAPAIVVTPKAEEDKPQESDSSSNQSDHDTVQEPQINPVHLTVKRKLTTRNELQDVIEKLTEYLDEIDENNPLEFNFND
jgi:hypothetical protein